MTDQRPGASGQAPFLVAGVDEAGRGPLAGPVVAAAVILDARRPIEGLADSKTLAEARREALAPVIRERALAWGIGMAAVEEIDTLNILRATLVAMQRALGALEVEPRHVRVDGNRCPSLVEIGLHCTAEAVVGGDASVAEISAASILAKTTRDAWMRQAAQDYPGYGFERHKGYGTASHLQALARLGPCPLHRRSFAPVKSLELFPATAPYR
jgi:ribonuclease HII